MDKDLDLDAAALGDGTDLIERELAREDDADEAEFLQGEDAFEVVGHELRGGVEREGGKVLPHKPGDAEILEDLLDLEDILAEHAANGQIAVNMFSSMPAGHYDAILMDVRMPEMDGLQATAAIRALDRPDAKNVPIIAMTANAFDEDVQRSLQVGMNAHLSKPVEPDHLYQTLEELIWEAEQKK